MLSIENAPTAVASFLAERTNYTFIHFYFSTLFVFGSCHAIVGHSSNCWDLVFLL